MRATRNDCWCHTYTDSLHLKLHHLVPQIAKNFVATSSHEVPCILLIKSPYDSGAAIRELSETSFVACSKVPGSSVRASPYRLRHCCEFLGFVDDENPKYLKDVRFS
jgi:hypothetical protein